MNCLDCAVQQHEAPAIGVCALCGAGVCLQCVRLDTRTMPTIGSPGVAVRRTTRSILCEPCAVVASTMHPVAYANDPTEPPDQPAATAMRDGRLSAG